MSMDPRLTTFVYILIAVIFLSVVAYMIFYTRGLKAKKTTLAQKGRPPLSEEEGIAIATQEKERAGRGGSI